MGKEEGTAGEVPAEDEPNREAESGGGGDAEREWTGRKQAPEKAPAKELAPEDKPSREAERQGGNRWFERQRSRRRRTRRRPKILREDGDWTTWRRRNLRQYAQQAVEGRLVLAAEGGVRDLEGGGCSNVSKVRADAQTLTRAVR